MDKRGPLLESPPRVPDLTFRLRRRGGDGVGLLTAIHVGLLARSVGKVPFAHLFLQPHGVVTELCSCR